jgi:prepilin-type N-terminal cleavage/methylation domain-containing protein
MARARSQRGVTLIEIIVVLALAAVMMAVAVPTLSTVFGVDKRRASRELAATMRWTYEEATIRNQPMRIAYDLDHGAYWVESAEGEVRIHKDWKAKDAWDEYLEEKTESDLRVAEKRDRSTTGPQQSVSELISGATGGEDAGAASGSFLSGLLGGGGILPTARGGEFQVNRFEPIGEGLMGGRKEFPPSVRFWGVWTPQFDEVLKPHDEYELEAIQQEEAESQKYRVVYTHVFPGGYMEDSVVYVSDESGEDITSLLVEPLIGRVIVEEGEAEIPDTRDREQRE